MASPEYLLYVHDYLLNELKLTPENKHCNILRSAIYDKDWTYNQSRLNYVNNVLSLAENHLGAMSAVQFDVQFNRESKLNVLLNEYTANSIRTT